MRPLLDPLREGETVIVRKLDRLSRSLKDVLHIMEPIGEVGAGFREGAPRAEAGATLAKSSERAYYLTR